VSRFFSLTAPRDPDLILADLNQTQLTETVAIQYDFVYAEALLRYIRDKAQLLEDIYAILRPVRQQCKKSASRAKNMMPIFRKRRSIVF
jgi:hypothetical protein